jgi:hypothetical protein
MIVVVIVYHVTRSVVGQKLALILTSECLEESCNLVDFYISKFYTALVESHVTNSILKCLACTIMVVWPGVLYITKTWNFETVTVSLMLSLLETSVIFVSQLKTTLSEVVTTKSHKFI